MRRKIIYIFVFFIAVAIRLLVNFKYDLIPGINGGYYPLQVRSILTNGNLGFSDMPLYFYFNAFVVKVISFFVKADINSVIILVLKIVDSIFLPLLLIPFYELSKKIENGRIPFYQEIVISLFAVCSVSPLIFTSGLQKNGFAIPFLFAFILFAIRFLYDQRKLNLFLTFLFFAFVGLSHFGAFSLAAILLISGLLVYKGKKALVPMLIIVIFTLTLITVFDLSRTYRLLGIFSEIFKKPLITQGNFVPPDFFNYFLSFALIGIGAFYLIKPKYEISPNNRIVLKTLIISIIILSFPFSNIEYAQRLTLILFVPQSIMLLFLYKIGATPIKISLTVIIILSILILGPPTIEFNKPAITQEAYDDLFYLKDKINNPDNTLIIARHGLEWWVAWTIQTKIAQDKAIGQTIFDKYNTIIVLNQKKGINQLPGKNNIFHEPLIPPINRVIYNSDYLIAYEWIKR